MNRIKSIRKLLEVTQQELADQMGCTQGNIGHYERQQGVPPAAAARLIECARARGLVITFDHVYGAAPLPSLAYKEAT
jgi:putative transcriptional regulator